MPRDQIEEIEATDPSETVQSQSKVKHRRSRKDKLNAKKKNSAANHEESHDQIRSLEMRAINNGRD